MPFVTRLYVQNFRSCANTHLRLGPYTPIVGYNNAGKSNLLDALAFALSPCKLTVRDFCDPSEPVVVEAQVDGLTDDTLDGLSSTHRAKIEPFCADGCLTFRRVSAGPETTASSVKTDVLDPVTGEWRPNPAGIGNAIKPLFPEPIRIRGMEDARTDAGKTGRTSLGLLVKELIAEIDDDRRAEVQGALDVIAGVFGASADVRPEVFDDADRDLTATLCEFVPGMSAHLHVDPPTFEDVVTKGATILLAEDGGEPRDIGEYGHGTQRSTQMALVHLLASRRHLASAVRPALLIDEPELYLHPQAVLRVRGALQRLAADGYQTVFSTHTPEMVGRHGYAVAGVVVKEDGFTHVRPSIAEAVDAAVEVSAHNDALFSFRNAAEMLFSDRVVVVEGKDDKASVEEVYELDRGWPVGRHRTGVVELGGVDKAVQMIGVLKALDIPFVVVADLDFAFRNGRVLFDGCPTREANDADLARCRKEFETMLGEGIGLALNADDGLPMKSGTVRSDQAFALLAKRPDVALAIGRIHDRMRAHGVWVWPCGAIEQVLGGEGKKGAVRQKALADAHDRGPDLAIDRMDVLRSLFDAIDNETAFWTTP